MPTGDSPNSRKNLKKGIMFSANNPERARMAQEKSVKKRLENIAERKTFKQLLEIKLDEIAKNENGEDELVKALIISDVIKRAKEGDQKAVDYITKMIGEEPTTKHELVGDSLIQKVFVTETDKKEINKKIDELIND